MQKKQNICEDMSNKRKKFNIYSEHNYLPKPKEFLIPRTDDNSKCSKGKLKPDYNQNRKLAFDRRYKNKPCKDKENNLIDIYLPTQTLYTSIPHAKNIYFYDAKRKCYHSNYNSICVENCCYSYSGTDVSKLLIFMEYTNNTIKRLLKDLKASKDQTTTRRRTTDLSQVILVIDAKKLKKFFNNNEPKIKENYLGEDHFSNKAKETSVLFSNVTNNAFDITIEQRCIGFKISICKYSFRNLLETLTAVCNLSRCFFPIYEFKGPSLRFGNWYFRNIIQGHLLRIILRNVNKNTLNVMRTLYFVLISDTTPSLNIQINFMLDDGIFSVYEEDSCNTFLPDTVIWNNEHRNVLQRSTSVDTWNFFNRLNEKYEPIKLPNAITYEESAWNDHITNSLVKSLQYEHDYEETSQTDDDEYASITYSDIVFENITKSDITINLTVNKSVGTSFIFSIDELSGRFRELEKKSASTLCDIRIESVSSISLLGHSKLWLSKLLQDSKIINNCLNLQNKDDYINETMFDAAPTHFYVKFVNKYWKRFTCQTLYKDFFKCLAQSVVYILFSYEL